MSRAIAVTLLASSLAACANYRAVGEFGGQTQDLTATVRSEIAQVDDLCMRQAELQVVISGGDERALDNCAALKGAQSRLAGLTLDVLDSYGEALTAIADDRRFDLDPDLEALSGKVQGLRSKAGKPLIDSGEVVALSKVVEVLFEVAATHKRDEAVKRLVEQTPNLKTTGDVLRRFFTDGASGKAPYTNVVGLITDWSTSSQTALSGPAFRKAEPIRSYELLRGMRDSQEMLAARQPGVQNGVQAKMVAAIDAWEAALQAFSQEALHPNPKILLERLKDLSKKARAARKAVEGRV